MLNTACCGSWDDLPIELLSRIIVISKKIYVVGGDHEVFRTTSLDMIEGMSPKHRNSVVFIRICAKHNNIEAIYRQGVAVDEYHLEAIYLIGMIYISRGPPQCDEDLQLLVGYFGREFNDYGDFLMNVDVVHKLTTNNITFQCEEEGHSVEGTFVDGLEEDVDPQRYCKVTIDQCETLQDVLWFTKEGDSLGGKAGIYLF
uniref:Uncharacterized protein n=1 Tax=Lactuca sativa TaxID=4236 RepID=A0A9R1XAX5_LACSA|nr:hypothetical protein LSAT_V11C500261310 [Lactuca sativa]